MRSTRSFAHLLSVSATAAAAFAAILTAAPAHADYTINLGTINVTAPNFSSLALTGIPSGSYSGLRVTTDWSAVSGVPYSNEARIALSGNAAPGNSTADPTTNVYYATSAATSGSASSSAATTLTWLANLATPYTGGNPLNLWVRQTYSTSVATWANLTVTLLTAPAVTTSTYTGTTVGQPTWNRPVANGTSAPTTLGTGTTGTAVSYSVQAFTIATAGAYNFLSTSVSPAAWDNYSFLYANTFNPTTPLANALIGNDDLNGIGTSGFSYNLTAGTTYYYVTTGYSNTSAGTFTNSITGPGAVSFINPAAAPEPGSLSLLGMGLAGGAGTLGVVRRKRKAA